MDTRKNLGDEAPINIADQVRFTYQGQQVQGVVVKKGSNYAHISCDGQREFRVPYHKLEKLADRVHQHLRPVSKHRRVMFDAGDQVRFTFRGRELQGVLSRMNPTRGHVIANDGKEYRVPYTVLSLLEEPMGSTAASCSQEQMEEIVQLAQELLAHHQLAQWSFQFDNGTKRAGCCHYDRQVISVSYEFAKRAPTAEVRDTLLHEIAHALVGKAHHHDDVWRAKALAIGCSGRRCHDLEFTLPRYIVKCERGCWMSTAERQKRGAVCKRCRASVVYETYTEEGWHRMMMVSPRENTMRRQRQSHSQPRLS